LSKKEKKKKKKNVDRIPYIFKYAPGPTFFYAQRDKH